MRRSSARRTGRIRAIFGGVLLVSASLLPNARAEDRAEPIPSPLLDLADQAAAQRLEPDARSGHYAGIVEYPRDALLVRIHLIRAARRSIDLQTFIWEADESARLVGYELIEAAKRGVRVRVIVDSMWSAKDIDEVTFAETTYPNIEFKVHRPAAKRINSSFPQRFVHWILPNGTNQRMHVKQMVVDGVIGLTGGRNIGDKYFALATGYNFKDREALVVGPQVGAMSRTFEQYWDFKHCYSNYELKDVAERIESGEVRPEITRADVLLDSKFATLDSDATDPKLIQATFVDQMRPVADLVFISDEPGQKTRSAYMNSETRSHSTNYFQKVLSDSRNELLMESPYVIFNGRARRMMRDQYKIAPDLRVRVVTNSLGAADHVVTYAANYRLRARVVLGLKFEVYEMMPHPAIQSDHLPNFEELELKAIEEEGSEPYLCLHSKTYIFDGRVSYIGTMNLDPRSFYYNGECGVFIDDEAFAAGLRDSLLETMAAGNSWVIAKKQRPLGGVNRLIEAISTALPIDPWPLRNTSGFELKPGESEVGPTHPEFYERYVDIGGFPGTEGLESRRLWTSFLKTFGKGTTPLL